MAVNWVEETKFVGKGAPLKFTLDAGKKLVPVKAMVVSGAPAAITRGEAELTVGTGLLTVKLRALDVPPPGAGLVTTRG